MPKSGEARQDIHLLEILRILRPEIEKTYRFSADPTMRTSNLNRKAEIFSALRFQFFDRGFQLRKLGLHFPLTNSCAAEPYRKIETYGGTQGG